MISRSEDVKKCSIIRQSSKHPNLPFISVDLDLETWCTKHLSLDKHLLNVCKKIRVCDGLSDLNVLSSGVILSTAVQLMTENCCPAIHVISDRIGRHGPNNLGDTVTRTIRAPWDCWKNPLISSQPMSANQCFHLSIGKFYTWLKNVTNIRCWNDPYLIFVTDATDGVRVNFFWPV